MRAEGGFRTGHEQLDELAGDRAEVAQAWASLLQIRHLTEAGQQDLPAVWERRLLQAVGLAMEAAGLEFAAVDEHGAVTRSEIQLAQKAPAVVRVAWAHRRGERPADAGETRSREAATAAGRAGWDTLVYQVSTITELPTVFMISVTVFPTRAITVPHGDGGAAGAGSVLTPDGDYWAQRSTAPSGHGRH